MWRRVFKSQAYNRLTYKSTDLPVYYTDEFDFYRCITFNEGFYGKTISKLHQGNLRESNGRYAKLFPNKKLSYWADSEKTALAEVSKHNEFQNYLLFWGYDDSSSTFPTTDSDDLLSIVDDRDGILDMIFQKTDSNISLNDEEKMYLKKIIDLDPDCLAYKSHAIEGGENYIFFEKGFKKLSLREVKLIIKNNGYYNKNSIVCAGTCDYTPYIESYGQYFMPIARIRTDNNYIQTKEYDERKNNYRKNIGKINSTKLLK